MRYLVETYHSSMADPAAAEHAARSAAEATAASGDPVRYVQSIVVPGDEVCFHIFEAPSSDAIRRALEERAISYERIVETAAAAHAPGVISR
jgi:hypothetical protein